VEATINYISPHALIVLRLLLASVISLLIGSLGIVLPKSEVLEYVKRSLRILIAGSVFGSTALLFYFLALEKPGVVLANLVGLPLSILILLIITIALRITGIIRSEYKEKPISVYKKVSILILLIVILSMLPRLINAPLEGIIYLFSFSILWAIYQYLLGMLEPPHSFSYHLLFSLLCFGITFLIGSFSLFFLFLSHPHRMEVINFLLKPLQYPPIFFNVLILVLILTLIPYMTIYCTVPKIEEYYKGEIKGGEFFAIAELSEPFTGALVGIFLVKEEVPMELVIIPLTLLVILMLLRIREAIEKVQKAKAKSDKK